MLTDKAVKDLQPHPDRNQWIKPDHNRGGDDRPADDPNQTCRGFGVKIMRSGTKTYIVSYRINGTETEFVIGPCSSWRCIDARKKAREVRKLAKEGKDPQAARVAARGAPTVADLIAHYREEFLPEKKPRGQKEDESLIKQWLLPELGGMRVAEVTSAHARELHRKITRGGDGRKATPVRANRVADLARHLFNLAITEWQWCTDNPFRNVKRNHEDQRERYLDEDSEELDRLMKVLDSYPDRQAANLIRFLLYTGARRGEVMGARWDQFNEGMTIWTKPSAHTKQERVHRVTMWKMASDLLGEIYEAQKAEVEAYNAHRRVGQAKRAMSPYVFPSQTSRTGHMVEIKDHWAEICDKANLKDIRVHDLRHSFASLLINQGVPLQAVGQLLGHTQASTTRRYAHLNDKTMRAAVEKLGDVVAMRRK